MSKMIQMKESTAKREVKQEYGLTETDGQAFWDQVNRVIGESREEVDNEDRVPAGYEVYR
ncbi:hypothetical protein ACET9O_20430 [Aeromonas caviae]|uniref:hypothetical protein n=1 Tax=Aeromonas caviae TaxID=648 RepID=UPI0038D1D983